MADQVKQDERWGGIDPRAQAEVNRLEPTLPMPSVSGVRSSAGLAAVVSSVAPSYHETRWPLVNQALAVADQITHGRAGLIQRLSSYLVIGGTAAVVNLGVLATFFHFGSERVFGYWLLANVVAYELSIMANFVPNDYFTFRHLAGHDRSWGARCLRFHITSLSGVAVTFIISAFFFHVVGLPALVAQAIALVIATAYNFTVHHLFTYAHKAA